MRDILGLGTERDGAPERGLLDQRARAQQAGLVEHLLRRRGSSAAAMEPLTSARKAPSSGGWVSGSTGASASRDGLGIAVQIAENADAERAVGLVEMQFRQQDVDRRRVAAAHGVDQHRLIVALVDEVMRIRPAKPLVDHLEQLALHRQRRMVARRDAVLHELQRAHHLVGFELAVAVGQRRTGDGRAMPSATSSGRWPRARIIRRPRAGFRCAGWRR